MAIIGIVAVGRNGAIGRGGAVPWHYSADLKFFRQQTLHHACVMGRKTWLSLPRLLKGRLNIVVSRSIEIEQQEGVVVLRDRSSVISLNAYLSCDLFIIGGEQIYRTFSPDIERWIVTRVPVSVADADTFMPPGFLDGFGVARTAQLAEDLHAEFYEKSPSEVTR
ncbi:MAG: dihydrofolate reductase [Pyrinomonadaceae bacterium]